MKIAKILHYCTAIAGCLSLVFGIIFGVKTCSDSIAISLIIFISMALSGCLFFLFSAFFEDLITLEERISDLESQCNKHYDAPHPTDNSLSSSSKWAPVISYDKKATTNHLETKTETNDLPISNETSPSQSNTSIEKKDLDEEADAKTILTNRLSEMKIAEKRAIESGNFGEATKLKAQIKNLTLQIKNL